MFVRARQKRLLILFLLILFSVIRFAYLAADPPWDLSDSAGIWTDGAHNVDAARNKILFGKWQVDAWNTFMHSPLWTYLEYGILSIIGVGFWQMKILPVLLSIFFLALFYVSFEEHFGFKYGLLALLFMGANYMLVMYNRLALFENLMIFFMALTLFFWQRAVKRKRKIYFLLVGMGTALVFIAKNTGVYFILAVCVTLAVFSLQSIRKEGWRKPCIYMGYFTAGLAFPLLVYFFTFYLPNYEFFSKLGEHWLGITGLSSGFLPVLKRLWRPQLFLGRLRSMPLTLAIGWIYSLAVICSLLKRLFKIDAVELFLVSWFLGGIMFISVLNYNPTRYFVSVIPATISLASLGICRFQENTSLENSRKWDWRFLLWVVIGSSFTLICFVPRYLPKYLPGLNSLYEASGIGQFGSCLITGVFFAVTLSLVLSGLREIRLGDKIYGISKNIFALALVLLIFIFNIRLYLSWALHHGYRIVSSSREIGRMLPPDSVILGNGVMAMTIENKLKSVLAPHFIDDGTEIFYKYNVTHLFLSRYAGKLAWYSEHYPEVIKYSRVIAKYRIWKQNFYLFEINVPEEKKAEAYKYR